MVYRERNGSEEPKVGSGMCFNEELVSGPLTQSVPFDFHFRLTMTSMEAFS